MIEVNHIFVNEHSLPTTGSNPNNRLAGERRLRGCEPAVDWSFAFPL